MKSSRKKTVKISDEDKALFRQAVTGSTPLKQNNKVLDTPKPIAFFLKNKTDHDTRIVEMQTNDRDKSLLKTSDPLLYSKSGIQKQVLRKLQRGKFNIEMKLDLHGLTATTAKQKLIEFLENCHLCSQQCVLIIHGKGLSSKDNYPVIKNKLNHWLRQRQDVLAFCSARQTDGGTGAIYLLLKKI